MSDIWEHDCVISGIGISDIGRRTGIPGLMLAETASREAIADAGLTVADIGGITTRGEAPLDEVCDALGIEPVWTGEGGSGVGGVFGAVLDACEAVAAGKARHVLVYRSVAMLGGAMVPQAAGGPAPPPRPVRPRGVESPPAGELGGSGELLAYHAYSASNWIGMHAQRHMHLYGTTKEQLGWLVVNSRRNAAFNPRAVYQDPLTLDDYLAARPISDPLGLLDCDAPIDGAIGIVVSHADYAPDAPNLALKVNASARVSGAGGWTYRTDYPKMASVDAAATLWSRTDLTVADVDVAELYDGFSFLTLAWLEAHGICGDGESGPYVEGATRIALDGELPLNTYGGQLSAGRMHGYWVLHEACTQLRGDAGARQVAHHEVALISTSGGPIATSMLLTR
ncbi:MAG: thiolase family protein [Acidimicrobiia bacterium]